jgi:hypothetical protein
VSLLSGTTASQKAARSKKATINYVLAPIKPNLAKNADGGLHELDDKHQEKGKIYEGQDDQDTVRNPTLRASTNRYLYRQQ